MPSATVSIIHECFDWRAKGFDAVSNGMQSISTEFSRIKCRYSESRIHSKSIWYDRPPDRSVARLYGVDNVSLQAQDCTLIMQLYICIVHAVRIREKGREKQVKQVV